MADNDANSYFISINRFVTFLTVLEIFDDESLNSTFRNKNWRNQKDRPIIKFKYKLGWNWYLGVSDITDYKLEFITQKFEAT